MGRSIFKVCFLYSLFFITPKQEALAGAATGIQKKSFTNIPTDASCDQDFTDAYFLKKACLLNGDKDQCENLAIMNKLGIAAAGGGIGAMTGKVYDSYLNKDLKFKETFLKAVAEIKQARNVFKEIHAKFNELLEQTTKEVTGGKYKSYSEYRQAWRQGKVSNLADVYDVTESKFKALAEAETNPAKKQAMNARLKWDTGEAYAQQTIRSKIAELFPKEMKTLNYYYGAMDEQEKILAEAKSSGKNMELARELYDRNMEAIKENLKNELPKLSKKTQLVELLADRGFYTNHLRSYRRSMFNMAKDLVKEENLLKGAKTLGRVSKGVAGGIVTGIGLDQTGSYVKQKYISHYLDKCKSNIGLSSDEVAFLDSYNVINDQNIVYRGSEIFDLDCNKLNFNMSNSAFNDAQTQFGGVPSGICKMMKKESDSIDKLFDGDISKIDCEKDLYLSSTTKLGVFKVNEFSSQGTNMSWDSVTKWPYSFFGEPKSNKLDSQKMTRLPCSVDPTKSESENKNCAEKQIVSCYNRKDATCNWVSDAAKARVGTALASKICPINGGGDRKDVNNQSADSAR